MSNRIDFNKLVRDKVPATLEEKGVKYEMRTLNESEFERELLKKVVEEATEVAASIDTRELTKEIADLEDVLHELKAISGISEPDIAAAKAAAMERKGGFDKRVYIAWTEDDGYKKN